MRLVLSVLVMISTTPAWAEWEKMSESERAVTYIDPNTIRKDGHLRSVWDLQDLKERQGNGALSRSALWQFDCKQERERILGISHYSGPMATGNTLSSSLSGLG